jgi:hypothetical protein
MKLYRMILVVLILGILVIPALALSFPHLLASGTVEKQGTMLYTHPQIPYTMYTSGGCYEYPVGHGEGINIFCSLDGIWFGDVETYQGKFWGLEYESIGTSYLVDGYPPTWFWPMMFQIQNTTDNASHQHNVQATVDGNYVGEGLLGYDVSGSTGEIFIYFDTDGFDFSGLTGGHFVNLTYDKSQFNIMFSQTSCVGGAAPDSCLNTTTNFWNTTDVGFADTQRVWVLGDGVGQGYGGCIQGEGEYSVRIFDNFINRWYVYKNFIGDMFNHVYIEKVITGTANPSFVEIKAGSSNFTYYSDTSSTDEIIDILETQLPIFGRIDNLWGYVQEFMYTAVGSTASIEGFTLDAYTMAPLSGPEIDMIQGSVHHPTTASGGIYNLSGFTVSQAVSITASKTGYNFTPFVFTPPAATNYTLNLLFIPDDLPVPDVTGQGSIVGLVTDRPNGSGNPFPGATVYLSNSTWTGTSTTANSAGFYQFDNLAAGNSYTLNATATGYGTSVDYSRSPIEGTFIVQNIEITPIYVLTVTIKDSSTLALIQENVTVDSSDGQSKVTSSGVVTFSLPYGAYTISAAASGYYPTNQVVAMTSNQAIILYLTKVAPEPTKQIYIAPHEVRFVVHDIYGAAVPDVSVTAVGWASTMPAPALWLAELFGINTATTPTNSTMTGTTGTDGSIVFIMFPAYKYNITFTKAGYNIPIQYIWPKEDQYLITAQPIAQPSTTELNWTLWQVPVGANQVKVGLDFNDTEGDTTSLEFYVRDTNKATVYHTQLTSLGWGQPNYTITIAPNQYWYWGFNATNTNFAENITADQYLSTETRIVNLPIPDFFQNLMSVAFIVIVMGLSGTENRRQVMVFDSFFGIFLTGIGVFPAMNNIIGWPLLFMALGFSVLYYMRTGERKEGT